MSFATIYTDASFCSQNGKARLAFIAKTCRGQLRKILDIECVNIHDAEMLAIKFAVEECVKEFPEIRGVYINCDNQGCVERFWTFREFRKNPLFDKTKNSVLETLEGRWIRTKHVKAHTKNTDIRSFMNRMVDKMTRRKF